MKYDLSTMSNEELNRLLQQLKCENKFNKSSLFKPYEFQEQFFTASSKVKRRMLCAANRLGKSYSGAMEMSYHLTGEYPSWWRGHKFDKPILAWAVGITGDSTRKVLQKELFGTSVGKDLDSLGAGSIPRDSIDFETLERDGNIIRLAKIRHVTNGKFDGYSTIEFRSTQQGEHVLFGATVDYIWLDEFDPYRPLEIYSQCCTRTATTDGHVVITATPEFGLTDVIDLFMSDKTGNLYFQNATWSDAPHLTPEIQEELLASIPEWQRDMRTRGIPTSTQGIVFPVKPSEITIEGVQIDNWDEVLWSLDITHKGNKGNDPTVLSLMVKKEGKGPDDGPLIILDHQIVWAEGGDEKAVADYINTHLYKNAPVIIPSDGGGDTGYGAVLKTYGPNVEPVTFYNPIQSDSTLGLEQPKKDKRIETGLHWMNDGFFKGYFKIQASKAPEFMREITTYSRTGKKGEAAYRGRDDSIDSCRYGFMSMLGNRGLVAGQCQVDSNDEDWNNGFTTYEDNVASDLAGYY